MLSSRGATESLPLGESFGDSSSLGEEDGSVGERGEDEEGER